jgi:orotate phosphoribosyltransferase
VFGEHGDLHPAGDDPHARRAFTIRRGYDKLVDGRNVLVVDDVINTGFSIRGIIDAARGDGGTVDVAASVCNRGELTPAQVHVEKLVNLTDITLDSWPREDCPLCRDGVPINTRYAHGADFVAAGGEWP